MLTPGASIPVRYTGNSDIATGGDGASAYFPAPEATSSEFTQPTDPTGFEMMAQFSLGATPVAPAPAPAPPPTPGPAAKGGVKLGGATLRPAANGKTLNLGKATNPPTAATTETLTLPTAGAARTGKAKKRPTLGAAKTTVPSGKTVPLKLSLNAKGRAILAKFHSLKATLTVVATNPQGETQTVTKSFTVKPRRAKKER